MHIDIQASPFSLTPDLYNTVHTQLKPIRTRYRGRGGSISVHIDEMTNRRGQPDTKCRIVIKLGLGLTVMGQARCADVDDSIATAALRATNALPRSRMRQKIQSLRSRNKSFRGFETLMSANRPLMN